jgi:kynureninase
MAATDLDHARALDAMDPLGAFRERFVVDDPDLVYLDGNSLGRLPRATLERLTDVVRREWGGELIRGWDHWLDLPLRVGDRLGTALLGARPGEVVIGDSTTVSLYMLAAAALDGRSGRRTIVAARDEFPTDRYVLEGLAADRGLAIRWLEPDSVEGPAPGDVGAAVDEDVALVLLSLVHYRSAAIADIEAITDLAHRAGALVLWDLSHAVGSVPIDLEAAGADLAVGCTYKYLDSGPGGPAFRYVRRSHHGVLRNPIRGWFAQTDQFAMDRSFDPAPGIRGWLTGTPDVLSILGVESGVELVAEAGMAAIRAKSVALTEYAITLHDAWLAPRGCTLGSPRDPARRGGHLSIRHAEAERLCRDLIAGGVVPDFRGPDAIRIGLSPLSTSFEEVWCGLDRLRGLLAIQP